VDAPLKKVIRALERLGFRMVIEGNHIAMVRENPDGTRTPLTMPNHSLIKGSTLRTILTQAGIARDDFLKKFGKS
jgi:predicted RNA binding protein YcfA (HicA-like mRNA interferase family)